MKRITNIAKWLAVAVVALCNVACDSLYDFEGDCSVTYKVTFHYDMNLKWADAFANEVKSVRLCAYDNNGSLVKEFVDSGQHLAQPDYALTVDLPAGNYHFIAWCGLDNYDADEQHFSLADRIPRSTIIDDLNCRLHRENDLAAASFSNKRLNSLFHGECDVVLPDGPGGSEHVFPVRLVKNTNHVRVILQQLVAAGESPYDLNVNDFSFSITDDNGMMDAHNNLMEDEKIQYRPWKVQSALAGIGSNDDYTRAIVDLPAVIADFHVARIMADHDEDMILKIANAENEVVAEVPIIDYALLGKEFYEEEYRHRMTDQEFLDREDDYVFTFFLDSSRRWVSAYIYIHSWRIVLQNVDLQ